MTAQLNEVTAPAVIGDLHYWTEPAGLTAVESLHYRKGYSRASRAYTKKVGSPAVQHEGRGSAPAPGTAAARMLAQQLAAAGREHRSDRHPVAHKAGMSAVRRYVKAHVPDRLPLIVDPLAPVKPARKPRKAAPVPDVSPVESDNSPAAVESRRAMFSSMGWATTPPESVPDVLAAGIESGRVILSVVTDTPELPDCSHTGGKSVPYCSPCPLHYPSTVTPDEAPTDITPPAVVVPFADRRKVRRELADLMRSHGVRPSGEAWRMACRAAGLPVSQDVTA